MVLGWRDKAVPGWAQGLTAAEFLARAPGLAELGTPLLTIDRPALRHNIAAMAAWCSASGLAHAPHGKTTMAPSIWRAQIEAGAQAITLATAAQLRVARASGFDQLVLANALLDPVALRWLRAELDEHPRFEFVSFVDSERAVRLMTEALDGVSRPVGVCVELGAPGGRAGCRDDDEAVAVAEAIRKSPVLRFAGVAGYEGILAHDVLPESRAVVAAFLERMARMAATLEAELVTAGGSTYFDLVGEILGPLVAQGTTVQLRAGCYVTHDDGFYARTSPLAGELRSAIHGWARVLSRPEPGLALLDGGKRDFPYDDGLPVPLDVPGGEVFAVNDQHAYLRLAPGSSVEVGDVVRLGLSHPCTAFDKWGLIPVAEDGVVVDLIRTYF
ncbi:alanine racemase [Longispora albida]|uniref:alanine racemase n=1 Tax=Longispora albida TaxID=203523 RepID=UPI00035CFB68|nr:alanine racemase [Longispora albida]